MADETPLPGPTDPKHLDDFKGTKSEQTTAKSAYIKKFGYDAFENLVKQSSINSKR
jgi:hypothetical protein